ncbi:hypothetical protein AOLI_G00053310 [Acnodon oligacanthus]
MKVHGAAVILGMVILHVADTQDGHWPVHTLCNSNKISVKYRSCDPLQDIGFTLLSSCAQIWTKPITIKLTLPLRKSIDEFYVSMDITFLGDFVFHHDELLCLPNFPRFTFCGSKKGEIINVATSLSTLKIPLKGLYNLMVHGINQDSFQIACVNATLEFH